MIYSLLSHPWSGLVLALIVGVIGWLIVRSAAAATPGWIRTLGFLVVTLGVLMGIGGAVTMRRIRAAFKQFPPPGKLVDVGGYRMHLQAEGDARGGPTLVWITGSHELGLGLYHLHKVMRQETRSIIFDRPGTGWSDAGPFPRTTAREADELATLLDRAGEKGPFIVIGHSYGGLLAVNFARRHPGKTAALVMADGTPPDVFMYLPGGHGPDIPGGIVRRSRMLALMKMFGLGANADLDVAPPGDTALARLLKTIDDRLADVNPAMRALSAVPDWATVSIFEEWRDPKLVADAMVYDNELADLPVFVVTPAGKASPAEVRAIGVSEAETDRALNFLEQARMRYARISTRAELIHTPAGTGHNYPFETPDFLLGVIRRVLADRTIRSSKPAR